MKNLKSIAGAVAFMVMWAGAAIAMPTAFFTPDETPTTVADLTMEDPEPIPVVEEQEEEEATTEGDDDGEGGKDANGDNHGKAVSTAAHCDLKGRAKGALVNSVARDKSATADSAQAACDAAMAQASDAGVRTRPEKAAGSAGSSKPGKAPKGPKTSETDQAPADGSDEPAAEDAPADDSTTSGPPAHSGPPADKGKKP